MARRSSSDQAEAPTERQREATPAIVLGGAYAAPAAEGEAPALLQRTEPDVQAPKKE